MNTKANFKETQQAELSSWFSDDPRANRDKRQREVIRYRLLAKQMNLFDLDASDMECWDVGCGPFGGVSTVLKTRLTVRFDPLMDEYKKHTHIENGINRKAEDLHLNIPDLIVITNALDHFESPIEFLNKVKDEMRPGTYVAMLHAINNAETHPHEAHAHNVNPELIHSILDSDFEFVWELDYQHDHLTYGWRKQPAFSFLARKVTGYAS